MDRLAWLTLILEALFGIGAFAGLFASQMGAAEKLYFGGGLILLAFLIETSLSRLMFTLGDLNEVLNGLFRFIAAQNSGSLITPVKALEEIKRAVDFKWRAIGEGEWHALTPLAIYTVWVLGGWLCSLILGGLRIQT